MAHFVALSGFLGAGKTTTLVAAARALQAAGRRVAVITNDQGTELVDTTLVRSHLDAVAEVTGGCFCCRFEDLMGVVDQLTAATELDVIIAEAVGSCTDLQATVVRPLKALHGDRFTVAPLTTVVDPLRLRAFTRAESRGEPETDLSYLFSQQITEAEIIAINKTDTVGAQDLDELAATLRERNPTARIVHYSATGTDGGTGLSELLDAWQGKASWTGDLDIDYDRYAAAEAQLAWLNLEYTIEAVTGRFDPADWGRHLLQSLNADATAHDALVGHAKLAIHTATGVTKLSITGTDSTPITDMAAAPATTGRAVINARIACEPEALDAAVAAAVANADLACGTHSTGTPARAFKPGYPTPVHRMAAT